MEVKKITEDKKQFLDLLLIGDEQENMIDRYLNNGDMFALFDDGLIAVGVITHVDDSVCELKNIAVYVQYQGKGYGKILLEYICDHYKTRYTTMLVGTGETPSILAFYNHCGFEYTHRIERFFTDNYEHPIFEEGIQLVDMIYLKKDLR